ncbi:MAG: hypothetical protein RLY86_3257, partial [Pseudomonadota bacterium]
MGAGPVIAVSLLYILALFAIAWAADRRAAAGIPVSGPWVYALSMAVFCTSWTFYGSVGRANTGGIAFLPTYLGPTLVMLLGYAVLVKILRIARRQRSTSIADFIAARYGRSQLLGGLVALVTVVGITPYLALQLKAVSLSFDVLTGAQGAVGTALTDTGFWVALLMAVFAIIFGTRSIDASEHHPGLVTAVAFESVVKLLAFLAVGGAVVWGLFDGPGDLFAQAAAHPQASALFTATPALSGGTWITVMLLSMAAVICLPRQFQVMVVENTDERHLKRALWVFPAYLLLINLFVLPVAMAGLILLPPGGNPDMMVLSLPLSREWQVVALIAFIGGLSAATGMIIVETVALATMVSNDLVLPLLLRWRRAAARVRDLGRLMLTVRRVAIVVVLLLGYLYVRAAADQGLVSIGLISFAAVAQFVPALLGGIYWTGATRAGALAGIGAGSLIWAYTLLLPSLAGSFGGDAAWIMGGPFDIAWLRPEGLLGLTSLSPLAHSLFWSLFANLACFIGLSLLNRAGPAERAQATAFVEVFEHDEAAGAWRGEATVGQVRDLLARFLGRERAVATLHGILARGQSPLSPTARVDADLIRQVERQLAGAIGAASARVALASVAGNGAVGQAELLRMIDETSEVIDYSRRLERKSKALEEATDALTAANAQLRQLDRMKDDFLSTVTHELRTPLTSIRALSELMHDTPEMGTEDRRTFLATVIRESERLTRLINQVLDFAKIEAGEIDWTPGPVDLGEVIGDSATATAPLFRDRNVALCLDLPGDLPMVRADRDRLAQVVVNLLSNAVKFAPAVTGRVTVTVRRAGTEGAADAMEVAVADNGPGIAPEHREAV